MDYSARRLASSTGQRGSWPAPGLEALTLSALPPCVGRGRPWPVQQALGEGATGPRLRIRSLEKGTRVQVEKRQNLL